MSSSTTKEDPAGADSRPGEGDGVRSSSQRRPRKSNGTTPRAVSPRLATGSTRCATPRDSEEQDGSFPTPDESESVADGNPCPEASRRKGHAGGEAAAACGSQGVSAAECGDGEGSGGRRVTEVGVSHQHHSDSPGGTLDSAGSAPSTAGSCVKVAETLCQGALLGVGTPPPDGETLQCSWGKYTDGKVAGCLMKPQYRVPLTCWKAVMSVGTELYSAKP